ncbi:flagellar protein FlaG [Hydrogenivirga caldilitoris]|uniref:Flagellar protein FlaG n=1 Tax=Hydrogenivirga caldilitoris TaxID=246264 RepID=A0A497XLL9_9AQUI|nr:flagellar protein FlaG [Hydrogenivirga caldilitoris]RLJ69767.1 flagellar protein FlaG [Hydrogenivirga caldilitoris]
MRVNGKGSEVDIELLRQVQREVQPHKGVESVKRDIERRAEESLQESSMSREELQKLLREIQRKLDYLNRYLKIDIDDQLEIPVVKVFERDTNRLIRQIPPDYVLELMKRIDQMLGVLLSERV